VLAAEATPPERPLLAVSDVHKSYWARHGLFARGAENRAIDGVSLSIRAGEILGLVGESGCGKSTFAKVLLGLEQADAGTMQFDGQPIFGPGMTPVPPNRRGIQMVFQDPFGSLNPRKPVRDIISEGLRIRGGLSRRVIAREVARHLALVGLAGESMGKYPHEFSGGQRQRICIARAIIMQPKLLIADEAVSALDVSVQMQILNLLLDLREQLGLTIMFISHDMGVIEYLCDRICVMYQGRIVEQGATAEVIDAARHPYTARLIAARPRIADAPRPSLNDTKTITAG
jgi:ABC-type glutathione transport system ATPase component